MDHITAGEYWNKNAEAWTKLARAGYDVYRDHLNTPGFLAMLPPVVGLYGLDIGCGEGHNTRKVAALGASMAAIDIAEVFIRHARSEETRVPLGIIYQQASAVELPFAEGEFDFATAFMSVMDIPETERVLAEAFRILKPNGFLQFSLLHPCFNPPHRRACRDEDNVAYAIEVGDYFIDAKGRIDEWTFGVAPLSVRERIPKFKVPRFHRPISQWFNLLIAAGFLVERVEEPMPSDEVVRAWPVLQEAQVAANFLHVRVRKPGAK